MKISLGVLMFALSAFILAGCGEDAKAGKNGAGALTILTAEAAGENCELGGTRVDTGLDVNGDKALSEEEIQSTEYICNGEDGTDGTDGTNGTDGTDGTDGVKGDQGEQGDPGLDGEPGIDGEDGLDGQNGTDGKDGEPGLDGENGTDGLDGEPGIDGEPGADGLCAGNNAPSIDAIEVNGDLYEGTPKIVKVNDATAVIVITSDTDGDSLTYKIAGNYAEITDNGGGSFTVTPKVETKIYFSVIVSDGCQIVVKSFAIKSAAEIDPPAKVTSLVACSGNGMITLSWVLPADTDFTKVRITWLPADGISQPVEVLKSDVLNNTFVVTGLVNGASYTFSVKSIDEIGNTSVAETITAAPVAPYEWNGAKWYTGGLNQSCNELCSCKGGFDAVGTMHTGNQVGMYFYPAKDNGGTWETIECSSTDNNTNWGANGNVPNPDWKHEACHNNCACNL